MIYLTPEMFFRNMLSSLPPCSPEGGIAFRDSRLPIMRHSIPICRQERRQHLAQAKIRFRFNGMNSAHAVSPHNGRAAAANSLIRTWRGASN